VTLLDTSSLIHFLRLKGDPIVKARVKKLIAKGDAVLCDLVAVEIWMGVASAEDERDVRRITETLPCLPTDDTVWSLARKMGFQCRRAGTPVPSSDLLIAACAFAHGAEIEADDRHFALLRDAFEKMRS